MKPFDPEETAGQSINRLEARIEALEVALRRIRDDGKNCADYCRQQARRALEKSARQGVVGK